MMNIQHAYADEMCETCRTNKADHLVTVQEGTQSEMSDWVCDACLYNMLERSGRSK